MYRKKKFSTFSYKLVQISPIRILVNSGAFLSISSWFCELTELIFVMIPYIPPKTQGIMGHVHVVGGNFTRGFAARVFPRGSRGKQMSAPPNIARSLTNPASYAGYF